MDSWGYSIIHQCALYNRLDILQFTIEQFKQACRHQMKTFRLENGELMSKQDIEKNINLAIT